MGASQEDEEEGAIGLLVEMLQHLLPLNLISWNSAMSACEKAKQWL